MIDRLRPRLRWLMMACCWSLMFLLLTSCYVHPLRVTSSVSPEPRVGQVVNYHIELSTLSGKVPNTTLTITLPSGVELVSGNLYWHGDLTTDQTVTKDLAIRVTSPGEWIVKAYADTDMGSSIGHTYLSANQALYITSSTDSAEVVDALKKTPTPCGPDIGCGTPLKPITPTTTLPKP
jgi:hypothetical protein